MLMHDTYGETPDERAAARERQEAQRREAAAKDIADTGAPADDAASS